jgi:hypothetical protein
VAVTDGTIVFASRSADTVVVAALGAARPGEHR